MTSPALRSVQRLRRIAGALRAGELPDRADAVWFAAALQDYLENFKRGAVLETCLDLSTMPGEASWATAEAIEARNAALRQMVQRFWPDRRPAVQAHQVEKVARRYAASAWRFDERVAEMPARYHGAVSEYLWRAFKSGARMPLKKRQLTDILGADTDKAAA